MTQQTKKRFSSRWTLPLLFVLFFGPMLIAWLLYENQDKWSRPTTNVGRLIQPMLPLQELTLFNQQGRPILQQPLRGKWLMLLVNPGKCQEYCQTYLYNTRQVRLALGKDKPRVERLLLNFSGVSLSPELKALLAKEHPEAQLVWAKPQQVGKLFAKAPSKKIALSEGYLYLVDPLGNIMMSYGQNDLPKGLHKDLKKLLKVSKE